MGETIVFTSGKGGVGKTTTIANIGAGLSQLDKKVVMLDTDMGLRNLDVVMGLEDRINYNLLDLLENKCRLNQALIKDKLFPNLYMIPASLKTIPLQRYEEAFSILMEQLKQEFDYCLIDCPAGIDQGFRFATSVADRAIILTTPHISAVKDAGRVLQLLNGTRITKVELIINEYDERLVRKKYMLSKEALNEVAAEYENARIFGDIGCYTLGALAPFNAIHACVEMGASITMAKGASDAGQFPSFAVIGDSTFTHSGITGLLDCVNSNANVVVIISDNLTTGMTGGQNSAGTGKIEDICRGVGVHPDHVRVVVPLPKNMEEIKSMLREEIEYNGVSVIIPRRECIQTAKRHAKARSAEKNKE